MTLNRILPTSIALLSFLSRTLASRVLSLSLALSLSRSLARSLIATIRPRSRPFIHPISPRLFRAGARPCCASNATYGGTREAPGARARAPQAAQSLPQSQQFPPSLSSRDALLTQSQNAAESAQLVPRESAQNRRRNREIHSNPARNRREKRCFATSHGRAVCAVGRARVGSPDFDVIRSRISRF